ncbi:MAG: hypothetical protein HRU31_15480 [Rhodobacteraceae bacterium]|nr:hypothetical protein [Paracoccaceae bacterium]
MAKPLKRRWAALRGGPRWPSDSIHFLHVSKAAGSQINDIIKQINAGRDRQKLISHQHEVWLQHLPPDARYVFNMRDPASRFKSGFYGRKRKGRPRNNIEWSGDEHRAFLAFPHANDLAEALFAPGQTGREATAAIRSIRHTARNFVDWFRFEGYLFDENPPLWIIRQERFDDDLAIFLKKIGHHAPITLHQDAIGRHSNDYSDAPELSPLALENLRRWYAQDYAFLDLCNDWMARNA